MSTLIEELKKATELTRQGKLTEATSTIQRALAGSEAMPASDGRTRPHAYAGAHPQGPDADVADVPFRELPSCRQRVPQTPLAQPAVRHGVPVQRLRVETGRAGQAPRRPASFEAHRFSSGARTYTYRLYLPPSADGRLLPVIVMLHGCTQDSAGFAAGTAMNELAAQRGCIVIYPEQLARANTMRCWNWFDPSHQCRGRGEPAMIAALAMHVVEQYQGDPRRVYVAGLSAGGSMAALVGQLYPDVFAAVGVHSGLPAAAATDVQSAHAAMRTAARKTTAGAASSAAVPTIVFHGASDRIVHPDNGRQVIQDAAARAAAAGLALQREEQQVTVAGRAVTRTLYKDARQLPRFEHWEIAAGTHAWSGGSASGSYTEPSGPGASAAMIDFFLVHQLVPDPGVGGSDSPVGTGTA